jgi:hypothetical protein
VPDGGQQRLGGFQQAPASGQAMRPALRLAGGAAVAFPLRGPNT